MSAFHADQPEIPRPAGTESTRHHHPAAPASPGLARYRVVLQQDATKDLMYVVRCVMELTRFPRAEATHKMWEAYHRGRSVILQTHLERAELYAEQFAGKGLLVTLEPA
jgi:ATP-dependent Clp protease adaptor protein ClpS